MMSPKVYLINIYNVDVVLQCSVKEAWDVPGVTVSFTQYTISILCSWFIDRISRI